MQATEAEVKEERGISRFLLRAAAVLLVAYAAGFVVFAAELSKTPPAIRRADGIVALTGGDARLDAAVALFEHGVGERLLISGVHATTTKAELKKLSHGGARFDCCADLGFAAADTRGNAAEAAAWAKAHRYKSLVLVTSNYHMPRAEAEFATAMPDVKIEPYPVDPEDIDLHHWWRDVHALRLLQTEYAKYLASLVLTAVASPKAREARDPHALQREAKSDS